MSERNMILIVDDEPTGQEALEALLFTEGYHLVFANNGEEALEKAEALTPDVILLDVMMPGMTGFEVCRHLRANPDLAEVPVIMVTALDDQDSYLKGIEAGADDFITKPFSRIKLRARVRTITRLNRYRRLMAERAKFEWAVEQAEDGYLMVNNEDIILYANQKARMYLGLSEEETLPSEEKMMSLVKKQYHVQPPEAWKNWPDFSQAQVTRYLVQPESITTGAFWLQVDLMDMQPNLDGSYLVRIRDVTNTVVEQRLMWTFHKQISHKLRTPLNHLTASFNILESHLPEELDPNFEAFFSIANESASQLEDEIQDIFQYIEAPSMARSDFEQCRVEHILQLVKTIQEDLQIKSVEVEVKISEPEKLVLSLSQQASELILREILENAKKFHPKQSPNVKISISKEKGEKRKDQKIYFHISDDGVHLSSEQLAKIWTPYYQAEKYFTGQVRGTGLGLSLVASLVWSVGGTCQAYNREKELGLVIEIAVPKFRLKI